jgi:hypothetical protein
LPKAVVSEHRPEYNERYRKRSEIQLGDLQSLFMALGVVDDYLLWLQFVKGWTLPGAGQGIHEQVKEARSIARALYDAAEKCTPSAGVHQDQP